MQLVHSFAGHDNFPWGVRVMLLTAENETGPLARRMLQLGARVEQRSELYTALSDILDDPSGYGLFLIDCDTTNAESLEGATKSIRILAETGRRIPVILVSKTCAEQKFPENRDAPIELRAPLSAVSARVGFEHALRDRIEMPVG